MMTIFVIFVVCLHLPAVYSVDVSYTIMSYNIDCRVCDLHHENGKSWRERFENERDTISRYRPDLIGIQEPVFKLDVRELEMPGYKSLYFNDTTWVPWGAYPDAVIYYKEARFEVLSFDHFWLGPHPDTFPTGFDRLALPRLAIYALLKDKLDGTTFYFGSTHFDHGDNTEGKSVDCYESAKELINITAPLASKVQWIN